MANELFIELSGNEAKAALLSDKKIVELYQQKKENHFAVGDVYCGTIKKLLPGYNAAFVDIGHDKDAFLHYSDLGPYIKSYITLFRNGFQSGYNISRFLNFEKEPETLKNGNVDDFLKKGLQLLVQITKEPISTKGPRVSAEISVAGTYLILVPFYDRINVSKKIIERSERSRLKIFLNTIRPNNLGLIVRTAAQNVSNEVLKKEVDVLLLQWDSLLEKIKNAQPKQKIFGDPPLALSVVRDLMSFNLSKIQINDEIQHDQIKSFLEKTNPSLKGALSLYKNEVKLFDQTGINKQIKQLFGRIVPIYGGAHLVIEQTEALHVIDVNSGSNHNADNNQEANALQTNIEAAKEIARQIRLRDLGGIIVVDFIDQKLVDNKKKIYTEILDCMKQDRASHSILPISKFGLMQITRERVRDTIIVPQIDYCPSCNGTGNAMNNIPVEVEIKNNIIYLAKYVKMKKVTLALHPFLAAYFTKGIIPKTIKWLIFYKINVKIVPHSNFGYSEYRFFDDKEEEIKF